VVVYSGDHYIADVVAGYAFAWAVYAAARRARLHVFAADGGADIAAPETATFPAPSAQRDAA
jgi:hypothetical protein